MARPQAAAPQATSHGSTASAPSLFGWTFAGGTAVIVAVACYAVRHPSTPSAQTVGDVSILFAVVAAVVSCALAASRTTEERPAWTMMALAAASWATAQAIWTTYGITRNHVYPFPSLADVGYVGYALPAVASLLLFPKLQQRTSSWFRAVLDALVIALAVLFVSWSTILETVVSAGGETALARLTGLAYPVVDVVVASLVLALGMRRPAGQRRAWLLLGGGLVVLAVTDSTYVFLVYAGHTGLTGTPLTAGWMTAWLLVALAPWATSSSPTAAVGRQTTLAIELVPYAPVVVAIVIAGRLALAHDRFLLVSGSVLLVAVAVRQVMIVYENVTLTRDLEAKVALRTTELARLGAIVSSSPDAIFSKTSDGLVISWNAGAERLYGWRAEEIVGRDVSLLVPASLQAEEDAILARVRQGEQVKNESDRLRKDGSTVPVALTVSPIFEDGVVTGIASIQQDVTERRAKDAALASAREDALESSRLKSEFLATMSHEIRTPMNGVIGLTSLLLETPLDDRQRQYADGVRGAGEALLAVINDILDFSKLEAGKVELTLYDFDPRRLVEEVASLLAPTAHAKRLELVAYCRPEVPALLVGDGGRIRQVLLNLASNAVKFTSTGEVAITVRATSDDTGRVLVRFEVADTGIGISTEDHGRLFESFSQADASTTRRFGGTGLGLAISRRLTEAMSGSIGVDSDVGAGSTFWFEVPLTVAAADEVAGVAPRADILTDLAVLVVDDNATNRLVLESHLTAWGMHPDIVEHPGSVPARLHEAAEAGHPYAIAVLDMCMPEMNGLELARLISGDETLSSTRVIMLTSTMHVDGDMMRKAGVGEWLTKPVRSSEFYDRLMRLMAPSPTGAPPKAHQHARARVSAASLGRILVVEDNALNQIVAEGVVSNLGYEVDIVANGIEALGAISANTYSAVLMDCHMPSMDGFEATRQIRRRQDGGERIPIIAMTAGAMAEDRQRCLAAGMDDYVSKPVNVEAVHDVLAHWVQHEPAPAPVGSIHPPAQPDGGDSVIDLQRQSVLRALGPDDGWGLLPLAVNAFLQDSPGIISAMRLAVRTGDSHTFGESAHQLKGAASNIGVPNVAALCHQAEDASSNQAPPDGELLDLLETELARATSLLRDALPVR